MLSQLHKWQQLPLAWGCGRANSRSAEELDGGCGVDPPFSGPAASHDRQALR